MIISLLGTKALPVWLGGKLLPVCYIFTRASCVHNCPSCYIKPTTIRQEVDKAT